MLSSGLSFALFYCVKWREITIGATAWKRERMNMSSRCKRHDHAPRASHDSAPSPPKFPIEFFGKDALKRGDLTPGALKKNYVNQRVHSNWEINEGTWNYLVKYRLTYDVLYRTPYSSIINKQLTRETTNEDYSLYTVLPRRQQLFKVVRYVFIRGIISSPDEVVGSLVATT